MTLSTLLSSSRNKIHSSLESWVGRIPSDRLELFKAFVVEALDRLQGPFLSQHPPRQVLALLEETFLFVFERDPNTINCTIRRRPRGLEVMVAMRDQPFIVDTMRLFLRRYNTNYLGGMNLVFRARRSEDGAITAIGDDEDCINECVVLFETDQGQLEDLEGATNDLLLRMELARATVRDFKAMTRCVVRFGERCEVLADRLPDQASAFRETGAFLQWLMRENFVFMGVRGGPNPLGIETIEGPFKGDLSVGEWLQPHAQGLAQVRKSQLESPIHRAGRIDEILVRIDDDDCLFIRGMFTYRAVTQPSRNVPILRKVLGDILSETQEAANSHRYKGIANVFDSLPTEFLFTAESVAISHMVDLVFEAEQQQDVGATFLMTGADSAFCLVAMPKTQFSDELRRELEAEIVEGLQATYTDHGLLVGRYDTVMLHYFLTGINEPEPETLRHLMRRVRQLATPWLARLWHALAQAHDDDIADRLTTRYGHAFPESYTRHTLAERAVRDVQLLQVLTDSDTNVLADVFEEGRDLILRLYQARDVYLTDILPVLGNFGLTVIDSYATRVNTPTSQLHLDTFRLEATDPAGRERILERADLLVDAIQAVFSGEVDNGLINGLVLSSSLSWREVDVIRSYVRYGRQLKLTLSIARVREILLNNPEMCHALVSLFHARFDPDLEVGRADAELLANEKVVDELRYILGHDEDIVFTTLHQLITSTVRTNYYRTDRPFWYLSFKIDCEKAAAHMGTNRPLFEIFVHHKDVEGVHLRFGKVARGGLRWSDRDDYRTEVLSLASTQQVKNVVIVPTGSKGGFYLRNISSDRARARAEADHHYKTFIRGLLDVTDNSVKGEIVPPPRVVRLDPDDPYLVVAADKGTAHLSDVANAVSIAYDFWLGDAFASGGSNGYDHKKVGITARGSWVLVKRHFAELGIDPYNQTFSCVGIGDMGGDVFGNGLIETPHARLLAAFNHLHIFLDPAPDIAATFTERQRLFALGPGGGGWDNYDPALISEGGGVFDRRVKSIPLAPQARAMLGLNKEQAAPEEVIRHILKMKVDLLWNGGIGTYVKASYETDEAADDRANNGVRIDAPMLRARVIGEGGNLGFTHQGRIEADLHKVCLNTDAIDNSAGVDMSDHEVNLKILLGAVLADGHLDVESRNTLLASMTEEVAELVLANNDAHGRQLSRDQLRSRQDIFQFGRAIAFVERVFNKHRRDLNLPSKTTLQQRVANGQGMTRPELAVLSAWVKMYVKRELLKADIRTLPGYDEMLEDYFPEAVRERYPEQIKQHMLADDIVATVATTRMVADGGAAFFPVTIDTTGASVFEIATAMLKAQTLAQARKVRASLEELRAHASLRTLYGAWVKVDSSAREVILYWLSAKGRIPTDVELERMALAVEEVYNLQAADVSARNQELLDELRGTGIPEGVAELILRAQYLNVALMIWAESSRTEENFAAVAIKHLAVARATRLQSVLDDLQSRPVEGRWDPIALRILHNRFHRLLRVIVGSTPTDTHSRSVDDLEPRLAEDYLRDIRSQVDRFLTGETPTVATLLVLEERVEAAITRLPLKNLMGRRRDD